MLGALQTPLLTACPACPARRHHALGGAGALDLANAVIRACEAKPDFEFLYPLELGIKEKIETIAREVYKAAGGRGAAARHAVAPFANARCGPQGGRRHVGAPFPASLPAPCLQQGPAAMSLAAP
jgi:hypothetical protein